ncbi:MAG TPA: sensor histidine kinase, partial [Polyangiales bacterium]
EYIRYACVSLALCLVSMYLRGHQSQFLFPNLPVLAARIGPLSMALATLFVVLFMYDIVDRLPYLQLKPEVYEWLAWSAVALVVFSAFAPVGLALRVLAAILLVFALTGSVILFRLTDFPLPELRLYRSSWYGLACTIPIAVLRYADVLPPWWLFDWALVFGFTVHGLMTSLALPAWASGMEDKLAAMNVQLSDNVHELRQALARAEEATERAQRATKAKDEFVATMSHELRTPLNAIINIPQGLIKEFSSLRSAKCTACESNYLLEEHERVGPQTVCETCKQRGTLVEGTTVKYRGDDARCLHFLEKIERSGQHLLQMVNGVLDYSKLEAGRFELSIAPVELEPLIREASEQMVDLAQRKEIELEVITHASGQPPVMGDVLRLKQVLINLIANAIKFSEPGTKVSVRWSSSADGELIEVQDRGIGIAPADQQRIFESFEQVHKGDTRKYGGTGLGLSISRSLVRMHGGELSVRSELGKGATFSIRLPRLRAPLYSRPSGELRTQPDNGNVRVHDSRVPPKAS